MRNLAAGEPTDSPPSVWEPMLDPLALRSYPSASGSAELAAACTGYLGSVFGVDTAVVGVAACLGSREFILSAVRHLRKLAPERDIVLVPAVAYPGYRVSAELAGCRVHEVESDDGGGLRLEGVPTSIRRQALCIWVNSPANPTGHVHDLPELVAWAQAREIVVLSDEVYAHLAWHGRPASALVGDPSMVVSVFSASKAFNSPGLRASFYAGDMALVDHLRASRENEGLLVPTPVQVLASRLWANPSFVDEQRNRYRQRVDLLVPALLSAGYDVRPPDGGIYLWVRSRMAADGRELASDLARRFGIVSTPGVAYGQAGAGHVRLALVLDSLEIAELAELIHRSGAAPR